MNIWAAAHSGGRFAAAHGGARREASSAQDLARAAWPGRLAVVGRRASGFAGVGGALEVLELFALSDPRRAAEAAPTLAGVAGALGVEAADPVAATAAIIAGLLAEFPPEALPAAKYLAARGWPWGEALAIPADTPDITLAALPLAQWEEAAPRPPAGTAPVSTAEAIAALAALLRKKNYVEVRRAQRDYATAAAAAFAPPDEEGEPTVVLAEAGTGVGKTLGYLAPTAAWLAKNQGQVWLSTFTKTLQNQLLAETALLPDGVRVAVRKGRENYVCLLNAEDLLASAGSGDARRALAAGLLARWLPLTATGDFAGGDWPGWISDLVGQDAVASLSDHAGECVYAACPHYRKCFVEKVAHKAKAADVVIMNHTLAMLACARARDEADLAPHIVFDEGHMLARAADGVFAAEISGRSGARMRRLIVGPEGATRKFRLRGLAKRLADAASADEKTSEALDSLVAAARRILPAGGWLRRIGSGQPDGTYEAFLAAASARVRAAQTSRSQYTIETEASALPPAASAAEEARRPTAPTLAAGPAGADLHDTAAKAAGADTGGAAEALAGEASGLTPAAAAACRDMAAAGCATAPTMGLTPAAGAARLEASEAAGLAPAAGAAETTGSTGAPESAGADLHDTAAGTAEAGTALPNMRGLAGEARREALEAAGLSPTAGAAKAGATLAAFRDTADAERRLAAEASGFSPAATEAAKAEVLAGAASAAEAGTTGADASDTAGAGQRMAAEASGFSPAAGTAKAGATLAAFRNTAGAERRMASEASDLAPAAGADLRDTAGAASGLTPAAEAACRDMAEAGGATAPTMGLAAAAGAALADMRGLAGAARRLAAALEGLLASPDGMERLPEAARARADSCLRFLTGRLMGELQLWCDMLLSLTSGGGAPAGMLDRLAVVREGGADIDIGFYRNFIDPMEPFAAALKGRTRGLVITSATLADRTGDDEADWRAAFHSTGARHFAAAAPAVRLPSPFNWAEATRVLVITDIDKNDSAQAAGAMAALFGASGGGGLGLFTAVERLRAAHARMAEPLARQGIALYAQHVDEASLPTLLSMFRADENSCLLGTDALRDGIDVPGRSLRLVVFDRAPWSRPDLLHKARRHEFGDPDWYDKMQLRARMTQAFGRLIRRDGDRGVFVVLDRSVPTASLTAFPEGAEIRRVGIAEAVEIVRGFIRD
ncbi:hypothetical protein FACS1894186_0200 [Alphaproteobacteria bacterium]|nr:hypothetical protein FACS1894186_0200 [Alphaproteobacteria bacterium]